MKERNCLLRIKWRQIVSILCLFALLIPMVLMTKPAQAQSLYDDVLAQVQAIRQQLNQLMTTYNSMKPEDRAQMDAAVASSVRQALQQTYVAFSATDRARLDDAMRQATGYTFTQLLQSANTVPSLVNVVNLLANWAENWARQAGGTVTTPLKPTPPGAAHNNETNNDPISYRRNQFSTSGTGRCCRFYQGFA